MSIQQGNSDTKDGPGLCLYDLLRMDNSPKWNHHFKESSSCPRGRLESISSEAGNDFCADCGSPDPKWVTLSFGAFICIKCSGVHRSLGVHISKVVSVKLDDWTDEQVDALMEMGGNNAVNSKYEAHVPDSYTKPIPDSSAEERNDFIRRKYETQQFLNEEFHLACPFPPFPASVNNSKHIAHRSHGGKGHAFRNSWKKLDKKMSKKCTSMAGMIEFVGLIKVNIVKGTNLAVRDMVTSDPYVILSLGKQSMKTRVIKNNLNPVWNECIMLSIPENVPLLKLLVYDKDTFSTDDFMGDAEIDILPLLSAAKVSESSSVNEAMKLGTWKASKENALVDDGVISWEDGRVKQDISIKLRHVERGVIDIELECLPLTQ